MQCKEKPRLLCKKQLQALAAELEKMETEDLMEEVCKHVGSGYHVSYFNERQCLWMKITDQQRERLASVVAAALHLYIATLRAHSKGKEKFAHMQIEWMDVIRVVVHEQGPRAAVSSATTQGDSKGNLKELWDSLATSVDPHRCFADDSNALFWSVCRAVWNVCQQKIVAVKECDSDEEEKADPAEEASLAADEVSLAKRNSRLGHSSIDTVIPNSNPKGE